MPCLVAIVDVHHVVHYTKTSIYHYIVAIVDYTRVGSATDTSKDLVEVAQENSTNQTADVLVEDSYSILWTWKQFTRSENSTNQTAELSVGHLFGL